jgi:hypothetical protein
MLVISQMVEKLKKFVFFFLFVKSCIRFCPTCFLQVVSSLKHRGTNSIQCELSPHNCIHTFLQRFLCIRQHFASYIVRQCQRKLHLKWCYTYIFWRV